MFVELHLLQNFAPSNLNRDDTGSPKDCEFGGYRRARISSQCLKRAIRKDSNFSEIMAGHGGIRTRRLILEVAERVAGQRPAPEGTIKTVAEVFREGGIERPQARKGENAEKDNTKLILFMSRDALEEMADVFRSRWETLTSKGDGRGLAVKELSEILVGSVKVPDIALFGRMLEIEATKPFGKWYLGIDASCQVAHAISTNKASVEFDFYTAVDDLASKDDRGAGMMGTVEFNSACFYRYANIDLGQLTCNLGNTELARQTVDAFIRAAVSAIPSGKQHSMAAQNPPSLVFAVVREHGLWSLANAFVKPVRPTDRTDLVQGSIGALDAYWGNLTTMYGTHGIIAQPVCLMQADGLTHLADGRVPSLDDLLAEVDAAVAAGSAA